MTLRYVFTRRRYSDLAFMIPYYSMHFSITYLVFKSVPAIILYFYAARLPESTWFAWVSQSNHIVMNVHEDKMDDTWLNLQVKIQFI